MAQHIFARNLRDAGYDTPAFALPAAASTTVTSAAIDLETNPYGFLPESLELELTVPALTATMAPAAATAGATYVVESSTTANFATVARNLVYENYPGSVSGIPAKSLRAKFPSDCAQFIRAKVIFGASMTDASSLTATLSVKF